MFDKTFPLMLVMLNQCSETRFLGNVGHFDNQKLFQNDRSKKSGVGGLHQIFSTRRVQYSTRKKKDPIGSKLL